MPVVATASRQSSVSNPNADNGPEPPTQRSRGDTLTVPGNPCLPAESPQSPGESAPEPRPDVSRIGHPMTIHYAGSISRDFEQAIIDDDKSGTSQHIIESMAPVKSPIVRRGTRRRSRDPNQSRESSTSSRASDTANSVNAFADPRRRERANTAGSRPGSELNMSIRRSIQRTISGGTSCRRSELAGSLRDFDVDDDGVSRHNPVVDHETGLPGAADDALDSFHIGLDELDAYAADHARDRQMRASMVPKKGDLSNEAYKEGAFHDSCRLDIPKITTELPTPTQSDNEGDGNPEDSDGILDQKQAAAKLFSASKEKLPKVTESSRYSFFSSELEQTIHAAEFPDLLAPGETFQDLFDLPEESGVWWLDILNPIEDELQVLQRAFRIHRLTTEDIITQEAREKVELFKQYYFVSFRSFDQTDSTSEDYMEPLNVYMVVFREGIITITYKQAPHATNVRQRISKLRDYMSLTADWICYAMMYVFLFLLVIAFPANKFVTSDNIVDCFAPPIRQIEHEADVIEDQVFVSRSDDLDPTLRQIGVVRKKVMSLLRLLGGKADVIKGFAKRCNESYNVTPRGEIGLYLGDIQDHIVTMSSNLAHFETMLSRSHSNYLAQLSVDHIRTGNRANNVLAKITVLASILVPLNLICGLFGMNVEVPGRSVEGLQWFFGILGLIVAIIVCSLLVARRMRII